MEDKVRLDEKRALEKLYAAEVEGALSHRPQIVRSKAAIYKRLAEYGLCEWKEYTFAGRLKVAGWTLTLKGNATYCLLC